MADKQQPEYTEKTDDDWTASVQIRENAPPAPDDKARRIHEFREDEGYVVDIDTSEEAITGSGHGVVKLAKDGHTVLIPQPSDDIVNDPLNWSWAKKHVILFVVSIVSFLPDYGSATGAVTLIPQAA
jgi:hypothetical protein